MSADDNEQVLDEVYEGIIRQLQAIETLFGVFTIEGVDE